MYTLDPDSAMGYWGFGLVMAPALRAGVYGLRLTFQLRAGCYRSHLALAIIISSASSSQPPA
jgi:hypothetical protein